MSLPVNYYVVGYVYDSGLPVNGAKVRITDSGSVETTTDSDGKYTLNIKTIATDGNTIYVRAYYNGKYRSESFTLNITEPAKQVIL